MYQMGKSSSSSSAKALKNNKNIIGRQQQQQAQCKKHSKHKQSPGVCSLCLSEKLSKVPPTTSRSAMIRARARVYYHSSSSSSSSSDLSSGCDSYASPTVASPTRHHRRIVSDVRAMNVKEDNITNEVVFSKSKSMAHVEKEKTNKKKNNNVGRFWTNLLRLGRNDQKRVNAEVIDRKVLIKSRSSSSSLQQPPLPSSSTVVAY
ncbi:uncharacterized protein LOC104893660 [Beta vulgaris subsp. vulgaris]|uniref:uncharacterized protein LOC104893660 n=1 Tax=Beta vulgaris subsp. vulgaris TaxID=3555 RepID=UPI002036C160|nr:uncharacterized protein LOC104893660 [Beta vulgaris subsp. vulgaris]